MIDALPQQDLLMLNYDQVFKAFLYKFKWDQVKQLGCYKLGCLRGRYY